MRWSFWEILISQIWEPERTLKLTYFVKELTKKKRMIKDLRQDQVWSGWN